MLRGLAVVAAVLLVVPGWAGIDPVKPLDPRAVVTSRRVALDPADPARRSVGALTYLGGVALDSSDPAFGGFSAVATDGRHFTLVSDGGGVLRLVLSASGAIAHVAVGGLPAGPRTGWDKADRDSESLVVDGDDAWVGFESDNAIWRYDRALRRTTGHVRPLAMRRWRRGGGAESMVRLSDGRFLVLSEEPPKGRDAPEGLIFAGDPIAMREPAFAFAFRPPDRFAPSDACALPDGRLLVLVRSFHLPYRFGNRLLLVDPRVFRPGATVRGREIARLEAPLIHDNFEGCAVTAQGAATIVWLLSDDNQSALQRTLLLKFRLGDTAKSPPLG